MIEIALIGSLYSFQNRNGRANFFTLIKQDTELEILKFMSVSDNTDIMNLVENINYASKATVYKHVDEFIKKKNTFLIQTAYRKIIGSENLQVILQLQGFILVCEIMFQILIEIPILYPEQFVKIWFSFNTESIQINQTCREYFLPNENQIVYYKQFNCQKFRIDKLISQEMTLTNFFQSILIHLNKKSAFQNKRKIKFEKDKIQIQQLKFDDIDMLIKGLQKQYQQCQFLCQYIIGIKQNAQYHINSAACLRNYLPQLSDQMKKKNRQIQSRDHSAKSYQIDIDKINQQKIRIISEQEALEHAENILIKQIRKNRSYSNHCVILNHLYDKMFENKTKKLKISRSK